jgi:segregation and condensation protein A
MDVHFPTNEASARQASTSRAPANIAPLYKVNTPVYEGPLDLLLVLIERAELDITRLALAQVTDQYLAYLHGLQHRVPDQVSAFLVIAARLIQIKSEVLLPRPPHREEGEEDPGEALAQQLIIYRRFKRIAEHLAAREAASLHTYLRLSPPPIIVGSLDLSGMTLDDLVEAARSIFARVDLRQDLKTVVAPPRVTIRQQIALIVKSLRQHERSTFRSIVRTAASRLEIVVTFLALLELIKRNRISAQQERLFGDIELFPDPALFDSVSVEDFELEFGE